MEIVAWTKRMQSLISSRREQQADGGSQSSSDPALDDALASIQRQEAEREARTLTALGIWKRYHGATFDAYRPKSPMQASALEKCSAYVESRTAESGEGLVLGGAPGGGKTHLLVSILLAERQRGRSIRYLSCEQFFVELNDTYRDGSAMTEKAYLDTLIRPDVLALDDICELKDGNQQRKLWNLLDRRYSAMRATLTATNLSREAFARVLGERTMRRFAATEIYV